VERKRGEEGEREREVASRIQKEGTVKCCGGSYGYLGLCYQKSWISGPSERFYNSSINIFIEILHIDTKRGALFCVDG
jgi:hypothetical protein